MLTIKKSYKCKDGRWRAYCVDEFGNPHVVSYPRILLAQKLGRDLLPAEDVHHIDGNVDNNDITNLELQLHGEHQRQHSIKYIDTIETCMICGQQFVMSAKKWQRLFTDLNRNHKRIITCGSSCAGKASGGTYPYLYDLDARLSDVKKLWKK